MTARLAVCGSREFCALVEIANRPAHELEGLVVHRAAIDTDEICTLELWPGSKVLFGERCRKFARRTAWHAGAYSLYPGDLTGPQTKWKALVVSAACARDSKGSLESRSDGVPASVPSSLKSIGSPGSFHVVSQRQLGGNGRLPRPVTAKCARSSCRLIQYTSSSKAIGYGCRPGWYASGRGASVGEEPMHLTVGGSSSSSPAQSWSVRHCSTGMRQFPRLDIARVEKCLIAGRRIPPWLVARAEQSRLFDPDVIQLGKRASDRPGLLRIH